MYSLGILLRLHNMVSLPLNPPAPFNPENTPFPLWKEELENYILAAVGDGVSAQRKKAILNATIGERTKKVIANLEPEKKDTFENLIIALEEFYTVESSDVIERHIFNTLQQIEGENIDAFVTRLRTQASKCSYKIPSITRKIEVTGQTNPVEVTIEFKDLTDDLIRDRVIVGLRNDALRARLLRERQLTLETAIAIVRAQEQADDQLRKLTKSKPIIDVDAVSKQKKKKRKKPQVIDTTSRDSSIAPTCSYCGETHKRGECPAYGKKCKYCGGKNHLETVCFKKRNDSKKNKKKKIHEVHGDSSCADSSSYADNDCQNLFVGSLSLHEGEFKNLERVESITLREWREMVDINGASIHCKIDTGAECNVMSEKVLKCVRARDRTLKLDKSSTVLRAYGGKTIPTKGKVMVNIKLNDKSCDTYFYVIDLNVNTILGLESCCELGLVKPGAISPSHRRVNQNCDGNTSTGPPNSSQIRATHTLSTDESPQTHTLAKTPQELKSKSTTHTIHNSIPQGNKEEQRPLMKEEIKTLISKYSDIFDTQKLGCMDKWTCDIQLKEDYEPVQNPVRRIPFAIKKKVVKELERMEKLKVIAKCDGPTEWVNSMVVVDEPNKLRICLDPSQLNKYVMREHTPLPTPEETFAKIKGAKFFSHLDLKYGYWQLPLTHEASLKTTFNTPIGRRRFLRLPFGLNSANEIFQDKMTQALEGLEGVIVIFDDILIHAETETQHNKQLEACLRRCQEMGIALNPDKCKFLVQEVKYIGHIISSEGIRPDPDKIKDILDMPPPNDKKSAQRLLGMVTYLGNYIENLSEMTSPIRQLLHKHTEFVWTHEQEEALKKIKEALTGDCVLAFYNSEEDVEVHADASSSGLGAAILQNDRPVAYASRSLTPTEKYYAQIEKELLSVVFALERFNQYVYGKHITVFTDHKPLIPLMKKPIHDSPARIQRLMLRLQRYDINMVFRRGKDHIIPDTLSRAPVERELTSPERSFNRECEMVVHAVVDNINSTPHMKDRIKYETSKDDVLSKVMLYIETGWPESKNDCDERVLLYWRLRHELVSFQGMVLYHDRIVIPFSLQSEILSRIHAGHQGRVRCKNLARQAVYWNGISRDIDTMVESCLHCLNVRNFPKKDKLIPHDVPDRPFQKVACDIFTLDGDKYQVIVDYFSKWVEVKELSLHPTSAEILAHWKLVFTRFGLPNILMSDREQIYKSQETLDFCNFYGITKRFSSARYAQSNGQIERTIQYVKSMIKKCKSDNYDMSLALLEFHNTPLPQINVSPASLLMGRKLRTRLPCSEASLINESDIVNRSKLVERQSKSEDAFNKNVDMRVKEKVYKPGDPVVFRDNLGDRLWKQAKVVKVSKTPRSYYIENMQGRVLNRNSKMLLPDKTGRKLIKQLEDSPDVISNDVRLTATSVPLVQPSPVKVIPPHSVEEKPAGLPRRSDRLRSKAPVNYKS